MRILVCGGREYGKVRYEHESVLRAILSLLPSPTDDPDTWLPDCTIIAGGATGVDSAARDFAVVNWTGYEEYRADWSKYGRAAGPIRNAEMLAEGRPDVVIAFPGGRDTADMVSKARAAGVRVLIYPEDFTV